jgi:hypothetical protein
MAKRAPQTHRSYSSSASLKSFGPKCATVAAGASSIVRERSSSSRLIACTLTSSSHVREWAESRAAFVSAQFGEHLMIWSIVYYCLTKLVAAPQVLVLLCFLNLIACRFWQKRKGRSKIRSGLRNRAAACGGTGVSRYCRATIADEGTSSRLH